MFGLVHRPENIDQYYKNIKTIEVFISKLFINNW